MYPESWRYGGYEPDSKIAGPRGLKRPFENEATTSQKDSIRAGSTVAVEIRDGFYLSKWTDQEILNTHLTEGQKNHLGSLDKSTPPLMKRAREIQHREANLRAFRFSEKQGNIPKRFLSSTKGGLKKRRLNNTTIYGEGLPDREKANHRIDSRIPTVRTLKQILASLKQVAADDKVTAPATVVSSDVETDPREGGSKENQASGSNVNQDGTLVGRGQFEVRKAEETNSFLNEIEDASTMRVDNLCGTTTNYN